MTSESAADDVLLVLRTAAGEARISGLFVSSRAGDIAETISGMRSRGMSVDPITVAKEHASRIPDRGEGSSDSLLGDLTRMVAECPKTSSGAMYALAVSETALNRDMQVLFAAASGRVESLGLQAVRAAVTDAMTALAEIRDKTEQASNSVLSAVPVGAFD